MNTENDQRPADSQQQMALRLEWEYQPDRVVKRWRGYLRGYPDTTLVVLNLCEDRDDRCHMLGAVMPDSAEREHTRCLVTWAKMASEMYLQDFVERLTTQPQSAKSSDLRTEDVRKAEQREPQVRCDAWLGDAPDKSGAPTAERSGRSGVGGDSKPNTTL